jgi:hypothetical protein
MMYLLNGGSLDLPLLQESLGVVLTLQSKHHVGNQSMSVL